MGGNGLMARKIASVRLTDAGFPRLKSRIIERTGHFYYQDKDDLLWERVCRRLRATGLSGSDQYLKFIDDPISGPTEWARLEAEITIGETFFFRYAEQFAALRNTILPEIIERKRGEKRMRIWSAGCATGAEPYSVAILVSELLGRNLESWRINIVGTDINESFLASARRARFGKWALRSLSPEDRERYFLAAAPDQWQLRPEFRALVRFERHNLLSLLDGTSPLQFSEFDLILCRNVLIYFHPDTVAQVVLSLRDCLRDGGWMLLGHAEPNPVFSSMMTVLNLPGTVAYRRGSSEVPVAPPPPPSHPVQQSFAPAPEPPSMPKPQARPRQPPPVQASPETPAPPESDTLLSEIRAKANAGDFQAAHELCGRALAGDSLNAVPHFYLGLVLQGLGRMPEAEKSFLSAIYLDKNFAMAHYHLGLLLLAEKRKASGRRALSNAARIAGIMPGDHALAEGDGLTAKDLRNLIRIHLEAEARAERKG